VVVELLHKEGTRSCEEEELKGMFASTSATGNGRGRRGGTRGRKTVTR
jgi:hypothetical protein